MTRVDTSVWIDHFGAADAGLATLLRWRDAVGHPFVAGEIGLGNLPAHLLAATRLTRNATLWTGDRRLAAVAARLGVATNLPH